MCRSTSSPRRPSTRACRGARALTKSDLLHNDYLPEITIEPDTYRVVVDGQLCTSTPMTTVPLGRRYTLK